MPWSMSMRHLLILTVLWGISFTSMSQESRDSKAILSLQIVQTKTSCGRMCVGIRQTLRNKSSVPIAITSGSWPIMTSFLAPSIKKGTTVSSEGTVIRTGDRLLLGGPTESCEILQAGDSRSRDIQVSIPEQFRTAKMISLQQTLSNSNKGTCRDVEYSREPVKSNQLKVKLKH